MPSSTVRIPHTFHYRTLLADTVADVLASHANQDITPTLTPDNAADVLSEAEQQWGLRPLGYQPSGSATARHYPFQAWHRTDERVRLVVFAPDTAQYRNGRITVVASSTTHPNSQTQAGMGTHIFSRMSHPSYAPGVPVWSAPFTSHSEFLTALRTADNLMNDPDELLAVAALSPQPDPF